MDQNIEKRHPLAETPTLQSSGIFGKYNCQDPQWTGQPYEMLTRCRRCDNCLQLKRLRWVFRSHAEATKWPKGWFVTLTYRNTKEYSYEQVKKYLKRVRRTYKGRLSYMVTIEYRSKGTRDYHPHHHLLVFGGNDLTWNHLDHKWTLGHSKCKLLKARDIGYVTKYIAKEAGRVNASKNYGVHVTQPLLTNLKLIHLNSTAQTR